MNREQGWLHDLQGPIQNENIGPLSKKEGKKTTIKGTKIQSCFFLCSLYWAGCFFNLFFSLLSKEKFKI